MSKDRIDDLVKTSLEGIGNLADMNGLIGRAITTPSGTTVIPISKISLGFASGGIDILGKRGADKNGFGGGGGTTVSITPIAFLTINKDGAVDLIPSNGERSGADKLVSVIERAPEIIEKIKRAIN